MNAVNSFDYGVAVFDRAMVALKQEKWVARPDKRNRLPTWQEMLKLTRHFRKNRSKTPMVW